MNVIRQLLGTAARRRQILTEVHAATLTIRYWFVNSVSPLPLLSDLLSNRAMKVIEEIRLENLRQLVDDAGGVARFAGLARKQPAQISQLLNQAPDSKTKKPKAIGSSQAREFEVAAKKELGWMDHDHSNRQYEAWMALPKAVRDLAMKAGDSGIKPKQTPQQVLPTKKNKDG
jgi:hypothetical protein